MKILLVCSSCGGGGAERVATNLGSSFCDRGEEATFYYWDDVGDQSHYIHPRAVLIRAPGRSLLARIMTLRRLLATESIDVVFGFTDIPNIVCWGTMFAKRSVPVFIATVHSDLRVRDKNLGLPWKGRLIRWLHKRACRRANSVVSVSDGTRESLVDYYDLPPTAVSRIYNPVLETVNVRSTKVEYCSPILFAAAGRLTQAKNYPLMIRAVKLLVENYGVSCRLSIYGEGELRSSIQDMIDELDLSSVVVMHGYVQDLALKLAEHDIFLMSSTWEGFGNVLVEALDAGLRIVSADCPSGPREILADGEYGVLVPPGDSGAMADAIYDVSQNPYTINDIELRQHLQQFTLGHIALEYSKLLKKLPVQSQ